MGKASRGKKERNQQSAVAVRSALSPGDIRRHLPRVRSATVAFGYNQPGNPEFTIIGTGFVVDATGIIVTAAHVLRDLDMGLAEFRLKHNLPNAKPVVISFGNASAKQTSATAWNVNMRLAHAPILKGVKHSGADVACVKIKPAEPLPTVGLDFSRNPQEGDAVMACGFPYGLAAHEGKSVVSSFLSGIVSAIVPHHLMPPEARSHYLLQLPANPGNSGGPVFDPVSGCIIGIVSRGFAPKGIPSGLTIAEPIEKARGGIAACR